MAEDVTYKFNADVSELNSQLNKLNKNLENTNNSADKTEGKLSAFGKVTQKAANSFKKLGDALKGGFGVGLAVKAFDSLTGAIMENQEVTDALSRGMIVIRAVAGQLVKEFKPLGQFLAKIFNDPLQALKDFGKLLYENVVIRFDGLMELIPRLGNAISLLFEGEFKKAAQVATDAVGKVMLGVDNVTEKTSKAFDKLVEGATRVADAGKKAFNQSESVVQAQKDVARLQILYQGIVEKYDKMAEKQRQIRDEETKTIDERIEANKELQKTLNDGLKDELKNIDDRIIKVREQLAVNKTNVDLQNEELTLQQEKLAVAAKYESLMSETFQNESALKREALEIDKSRREAIIEQMEVGNEAALAEKQAILDRTDIIQNETDRLIAAKQAEMDLRNTEIKQVKELRAIRTQEFDTQLAQLTEGTTAYQETLNAKNNFLAESTAKEKTLQTELQTYIIKSEAEIAKAKKESQIANLKAVGDTINQVTQISQKFAENSEAQINKEFEQRIENLKKLGYTEEQISEMKDAELQKIDERARKNFEISKNINYAQTLLSTIQGTQDAFTTANKSPITAIFPAYPFVQAAAAAAFGVAQLQQISQSDYTSKLVPKSGGTSNGGSSSSASTPSFGPSVGIVGGQMGNNAQLAQAFGGVMGKPIKAYAVGQDMTSQQSLDRHISQNATLGK